MPQPQAQPAWMNDDTYATYIKMFASDTDGADRFFNRKALGAKQQETFQSVPQQAEIQPEAQQKEVAPLPPLIPGMEPGMELQNLQVILPGGFQLEQGVGMYDRPVQQMADDKQREAYESVKIDFIDAGYPSEKEVMAEVNQDIQDSWGISAEDLANIDFLINISKMSKNDDYLHYEDIKSDRASILKDYEWAEKMAYNETFGENQTPRRPRAASEFGTPAPIIGSSTLTADPEKIKEMGNIEALWEAAKPQVLENDAMVKARKVREGYLEELQAEAKRQHNLLEDPDITWEVTYGKVYTEFFEDKKRQAINTADNYFFQFTGIPDQQATQEEKDKLADSIYMSFLQNNFPDEFRSEERREYDITGNYERPQEGMFFKVWGDAIHRGLLTNEVDVTGLRTIMYNTGILEKPDAITETMAGALVRDLAGVVRFPTNIVKETLTFDVNPYTGEPIHDSAWDDWGFIPVEEIGRKEDEAWGKTADFSDQGTWDNYWKTTAYEIATMRTLGDDVASISWVPQDWETAARIGGLGVELLIPINPSKYMQLPGKVTKGVGKATNIPGLQKAGVFMERPVSTTWDVLARRKHLDAPIKAAAKEAGVVDYMAVRTAQEVDEVVNANTFAMRRADAFGDSMDEIVEVAAGVKTESNINKLGPRGLIEEAGVVRMDQEGAVKFIRSLAKYGGTRAGRNTVAGKIGRAAAAELNALVELKATGKLKTAEDIANYRMLQAQEGGAPYRNLAKEELANSMFHDYVPVTGRIIVDKQTLKDNWTPFTKQTKNARERFLQFDETGAVILNKEGMEFLKGRIGGFGDKIRFSLGGGADTIKLTPEEVMVVGEFITEAVALEVFGAKNIIRPTRVGPGIERAFVPEARRIEWGAGQRFMETMKGVGRYFRDDVPMVIEGFGWSAESASALKRGVSKNYNKLTRIFPQRQVAPPIWAKEITNRVAQSSQQLDRGLFEAFRGMRKELDLDSGAITRAADVDQVYYYMYMWAQKGGDPLDAITDARKIINGVDETYGPNPLFRKEAMLEDIDDAVEVHMRANPDADYVTVRETFMEQLGPRTRGQQRANVQNTAQTSENLRNTFKQLLGPGLKTETDMAIFNRAFDQFYGIETQTVRMPKQGAPTPPRVVGDFEREFTRGGDGLPGFFEIGGPAQRRIEAEFPQIDSRKFMDDIEDDFLREMQRNPDRPPENILEEMMAQRGDMVIREIDLPAIPPRELTTIPRPRVEEPGLRPGSGKRIVEDTEYTKGWEIGGSAKYTNAELLSLPRMDEFLDTLPVRMRQEEAITGLSVETFGLKSPALEEQLIGQIFNMARDLRLKDAIEEVSLRGGTFILDKQGLTLWNDIAITSRHERYVPFIDNNKLQDQINWALGTDRWQEKRASLIAANVQNTLKHGQLYPDRALASAMADFIGPLGVEGRGAKYYKDPKRNPSSMPGKDAYDNFYYDLSGSRTIQSHFASRADLEDYILRSMLDDDYGSPMLQLTQDITGMQGKAITTQLQQSGIVTGYLDASSWFREVQGSVMKIGQNRAILDRDTLALIDELQAGFGSMKEMGNRSQITATFNDMRRAQPTMPGRIMADLSMLSRGIRRNIVSGQLAGKYFPNIVYHSENVITAPLIASVTAPDYLLTVTGQAAKIAAGTPLEIGYRAISRDLNQGVKGTYGATPFRNVKNQIRAGNGDEIFFTTQTGQAITYNEAHKLWLRWNTGMSSTSLQMGDVIVNDIKFAARTAKTYVPNIKPRISGKIWEEFLGGVLTGRTPAYGHWANASDQAMREAVFYRALKTGQVPEIAADLARNVVLDYGKIPLLFRQAAAGMFLYTSFMYRMSAETALSVMRTGRQTGRFYDNAMMDTMQKYLTGTPQQNLVRLAILKRDVHNANGQWVYMNDASKATLWSEYLGQFDETDAYATYLRDPVIGQVIMFGNLADYALQGYQLTGLPGSEALYPGDKGFGKRTVDGLLDIFYSPTIDLMTEMQKARAGRRVPAKQVGLWKYMDQAYGTDIWGGVMEMCDIEAIKDPAKQRAGEPVFDIRGEESASGVQYRFRTESGVNCYQWLTWSMAATSAGRLGQDVTGTLAAMNVVPPGTHWMRYSMDYQPPVNMPEPDGGWKDGAAYLIIRGRPVRVPKEWQARDAVLRQNLRKLQEVGGKK